MKKEYDFPKGERGKFFRPDIALKVPVYLEPDVAKAIRERAEKKGTGMGGVVNQWLRRDLRANAK